MSIYIDEMKDLQLYTRQFYAPIIKQNRFKNSAILLVTPDLEASKKLMTSKYMINNKIFESYYTEKNIELIINDKLEVQNEDGEVVDSGLISPYSESYVKLDDAFIVFNEDDKKMNTILRNILYSSRIKSNKEVLELYDKIQDELPFIKRTYLDLDFYKGYNLFVDLGYFSKVFLSHIKTKNDQGLDIYYEFLLRFINDFRLTKAGYTLKTVFIDIDSWTIAEGSNLWDAKNINPISLINRYNVRHKIFKELYGLDLVFISESGYFKIRADKIDKVTTIRLLSNISHLLSKRKIVDDNKESAEAITTKILDDIQTGTQVRIFNVAGSSKKVSKAELADKVSNAIFNSDNVEDKKAALVDYVKAKAEESKNSEEAMNDLNNDEAMKRLIVDITMANDEGPKFSATRLKRINTLNDRFMNTKIKDSTVKQLIEEARENKELPERKLNVDSIDDQWDHLKFINFEDSYDVDADIMAIISSFKDKSIPISVISVSREDTSTSEDSIYTYTFKMEDAYGKRFNITLDVPKVKDRNMRLRGNGKTIAGQAMLLPIIKTDEDTVQIVSNYNKIFIRRYGTNTGKSFVTADKVIKGVNKYMTLKNHKLKVTYGDNHKISSKYVLPIDYIDIGKVFSKIETANRIYYFNQDEIRSKYKIDTSKGIPYAIDKKNNHIFYYTDDEHTTLSSYILSSLTEELKDTEFPEIVDNLSESTKYTYSKASILNTEIPVVVIMAYSEGLQTTLKKAGVEYQILDKRTKYDHNMYDMIRFSDGYILYKLDYNSSLLMNGLKECNTEDYSITDIDNKVMWIDFLDIFGSRINADGLDNFYDLMVDPITANICRMYKLPDDYCSLLAYANMLLSNNKYNRHVDITGNRLRTNELIAAYVYRVLSVAYGDYQRQIKKNKKDASFSIKRSAVIDAIFKDPTEADTSFINPLMDMESVRSTSFKGLSGMNSDRSYGLDKRTYDDTMLGVLALSTGFASNVGLTRMTTIDSNIKGSRGLIKGTSDLNKLNDVNTLCITEAMTPFGTTHDDPFRTAMTFIQTSKHNMRMDKSSPMLVSNGSDEALPYLTNNNFSFKAKDDGVVKELTKDYMIVTYKNGTSDFIDLREIVKKNSDGGFFAVVKFDPYRVQKGSKFKKFQVLAYDKLTYSDGFGEHDKLAYNVGCLAKIAILLTDEGFEDSAIIDDELSEEMASDIVVKKDVVLHKNANVYMMKEIGSPLQEGDPLIIFQSAFDEEDSNALLKTLSGDNSEIKDLGRITLRSKVTGTLQDIKMYRTVEKSELSPSLRKIFNQYESKISDTKKKMSKYHIDTKEYDADYKLDQTGKLKNVEDGVLIEFYLKYHDKMSVGDKLVYYSALKGVIKGIFPKGEEPYTDFRPHEKIRSFLTASSVSRRMTGSIIKVGILHKILIELDRKVKDIYNIPWNDGLGSK